ncbi:hypothetical protein RHS01_03156 [Rhizoctonia solani]|uniref:Uncharacterized protein n=1 Tax=Rhizoctonia solani TaxID=456999 RepID=A0A8H7IFM8_9AGAM|nr:hypothetical protein RHS01_03156 [Rhizoctonia solani]
MSRRLVFGPPGSLPLTRWTSSSQVSCVTLGLTAPALPLLTTSGGRLTGRVLPPCFVKGVSGTLMAAGALLVPPGVSSCSPGTLTAASAFLGTAASPSLGASAIMQVLIAGVGQLNTLRMGGALFVRAA